MDHTHKNQIAYAAFENEARGDPKGSCSPLIFGGFEWEQGANCGVRMPGCTITELSERPSCPLRIVFAPLDLATPEYAQDLLALYRLYSIPGAFVSERLHHVACSFGNNQTKDESRYSWFHFLCKNIPTEEVGGIKHIVNKNRTRTGEKDLSQADFSWVRSAYCLKTKSLDSNKSKPEVALVVFGGGVALWQKFDALSTNTSWQELLRDPYCLFDVVFECLYAQIDNLAWDLAQVYGQEEEKILRAAQLPGSAADKLDFVGLHMLSKHEIYLLEATEAAISTLESLKIYHEKSTQGSSSDSSDTEEVQSCFRHRRTLFKSTDLRLKSLEKRTQNMVNLSFNLVTQADSRVMRADSSSMKTIAAMTLVFLPCTAVATMFSTPFFYLSNDSNDGPIRMSPYFWLIWVISIPLTLLVMYAWYRYQNRLQERIVGGSQPLPAQEMV